MRTLERQGTEPIIVGSPDQSLAPPDAGEAPADVVARARRGDRAAFGALVAHYDRRLRGLAYRILGDRDLMDDAMQEVVVRVWRGLPRFRGDARLSTWLYRVTYTTCLNCLRARESAVQSGLSETELGAAEADPADGWAERLDLAAALARLSPLQRSAVYLVIEQGFDYEAAAKALGVPRGTLASRVAAARQALTGALRDATPREEER